MELKRHKTLIWTLPLTRVLLLQSVWISSSYAVDLNNLDSTDNADARLAQLNLASNPTENMDGIDLYLDVTLNGSSVGLTHFKYDKNQLWATIDALKQLGFILPPNITDPVKLSSLTGVKIDYNARQQTVSIIAPLNMLNLSTTVINTRDTRRPQPTASPGILLNYNLYGSRSENNSTNLSAFTELRAFNAKGVLSSTALTTGNRFSNSSTNNDYSNRD